MPDWIAVIDGGANRGDGPPALRTVQPGALPFRDSHEDIRTVRLDLKIILKLTECHRMADQSMANRWRQNTPWMR